MFQKDPSMHSRTKSPRIGSKLQLHRETLRQLNMPELSSIQAGDQRSTPKCTFPEIPTVEAVAD